MKKLLYIIPVICVLFFTLFTLRELRTVTTEHNTAVQRADSLEVIAAKLRQQNDSTAALLEAVVRDNANKSDSLAKYVKQIEIVTAENDSIKKAIALIPPDTIYKLMQIAAPDTMPKIYPFSARQTIFYYSEYIDNIGNKKLLKSYENSLYGCLDYSQGLGKQIELLNDRNSNTEKQLALSDMQTGLFKTSSENLSNKVSYLKKKQKYFTIGMGVAFVLGVIAAK